MSESTPPDDDVREALAEVIEKNRMWTRRMSDGYPSSGSNDGRAIADAILAAFEVRPRGPVTAAAVEAALYAYRRFPGDHVERSSRGWQIIRMRAALEAARGVTNA